MLTILTIVLPVFLVVGAGYAATRAGAFSDAFNDGLMKFSQGFAIPCLLFLAVARLDLAEVFHPDILLPFYAGSTTCFVLGGLAARIFFKRRPGEAVAVAFCALFANSVLLGLPIIERAYGADAIGPIVAIVSIHAPFCYILGITTMELARADGRGFLASMRAVGLSIVRNSLMIGIALGFAANLLNLTLPGPVNSALEMMARAALPSALFGLGGVLARYGLAPNIGEIAMVTALRLVLHPAIAFVLALWVFQLPHHVASVIIIAAAMPPGVNAYVFANMYGRARGTAASTVLVSTVVAVASVSVWLSILSRVGP